MNIYEKLHNARLMLHKREIKKTGWNDFSKYAYFELGDFVVPILEIFNEVRLFSKVTFDKEMATMTIVDMDKPEDRIVFTSPMGGAALKGTHEIQQIGAVEKYQRRYLYVMAMDIVEHDAIDATAKDAYEQMDEAETVEQLQEIFAAAYIDSRGDEQKKIKKHYDKLKEKLQERTS